MDEEVKIPFIEYVLSEAERQWGECQEETYGPWHKQTLEEQEEYIKSMYEFLFYRRGDELRKEGFVDVPDVPEIEV